MFQVSDRIRMKRNIRKIDTYGLSPSIIRNHRKTIFWVSNVQDGYLRIYKWAKVYDKKQKMYVTIEIEFNSAYFNPEMFEKVEE